MPVSFCEIDFSHPLYSSSKHIYNLQRALDPPTHCVFDVSMFSFICFVFGVRPKSKDSGVFFKFFSSRK